MNPRISSKRYTRKFIKLISSFVEFWEVWAVRIIFSTPFLMGKTNEKLDFLWRAGIALGVTQRQPAFKPIT